MKQGAIIESGIPIPPLSKWAQVLLKMNPGDSILLTMSESCAVRSQARVHGIKTTSRTLAPNSVRMWRVE